MSKIVCDVCGTSFADSANQCPICGCAATAENSFMPVLEEKNEIAKSGTYTYVKGGRFSKANVKKRNGGKAPVRVEKPQKPEKKSYQEDSPKDNTKKKKSNLGLMIAVVALFLAIIAVALYITFGIILKDNRNDKSEPAKNVNDTQIDDQEEPEDVEIPCTELTPNVLSLELTQETYTAKLDVTKAPEDTTDVLEFKSTDESVVKVDNEGNVTAVGEGTAQIQIKCGEATAIIEVTSSYVPEEADENEEQEDENTDENTDAPEQTGKDSNHLYGEKYKLNIAGNVPDFTLSLGESFSLYLTDLTDGSDVEITITSLNTSAITVDGRTIKAVSKTEYTELIIRFGTGEKDYIVCIVRV